MTHSQGSEKEKGSLDGLPPHLRIVRPVSDLERSTDMYCRGLVLYSIKEMDTACCIYEKQEKSGMSHLLAAVLSVHLLFLWASPVSAYVWRCHSPHGDFWTSQPKESDDCSEYDSIYNPDAAPPMAKQRTAL